MPRGLHHPLSGVGGDLVQLAECAPIGQHVRLIAIDDALGHRHRLEAALPRACEGPLLIDQQPPGLFLGQCQGHPFFKRTGQL
jgi:hypothetical protein